MAGVKFTSDQQKAIDTLDKSILVAAAAGSGKTAVLVERIINIILQGKANVDELLVVTFTNAAAAEMKLKLTKAIKKRIQEDPEAASALSVQLDRMYRAYISTFHSFAMRIIKEFFYKIDIEPNFSICDEIQATLLQYEAIDELFEDLFEEGMELEGIEFRDFLLRYSKERSEDALKAGIISNYKKLRSMPEYMDWAYEKVELLKVPEGDMKQAPMYDFTVQQFRNDLIHACDAADETVEFIESHGYSYIADKMREDLEKIRVIVEDFDKRGLDEEVLDSISSIKFAQARAKKADQADWNEIKGRVSRRRDEYKDTLKGLKDKYISPGLEVRFQELGETYGYAKYYIKLIELFEERFSAKKAERNLVDFGDLEHITAEILKDEEVADVVRKRFKYIFIDEYQDTNKLQEYLVNRFARPDNVFKVGDIKQSIYGFRQSDPKIFMNVREQYNDAGNADATVIDLNMNFRSNLKTIDYINAIFENIMDGYDDKAKLYNGLVTPPEYDLEPELHIIMTANEDADGESMSTSEAEASHVAKLVNSIIGTEFYDSRIGAVRKATPRDIVILMRSTKSHADIYYKAMLEHNIIANVNDEEGYFDTVEIEVAVALLRVIDNMRQDVPLIAVLRSGIFGFTNEELAEIRAVYREAGMNGSYYNAFSHYINNVDSELSARARSARDKIIEWKTLAGMMPLSEFVWHVMTDSNLYLYTGAMYGGRQRQANLRVLAERAGSYQDSGIVTLGGFIRYLDILKSKNVKTGQAITVSEEDDVVRVMTIHKSKGLEFPFVILAGMSRKLRGSSSSGNMAIDPDMGLGITYVNREKRYTRKTIMQHMIDNKASQDAYEEELRVLYVALTRARQKLYMTATMANQDELDKLSPGTNRYIDMIADLISTEFNTLNIYQAEGVEKSRQVNMLEHFLAKRQHLKPATSPALYEDVNRRLSYEYPNREALETKAKYSVSELRALKEDRGIIRRMNLTDPDFRDAADVTGAEVGTAYHRIMETLDFRKALSDGAVDSDYIRSVADKLHETGAIDDRVFPSIRLKKIEKFFESEIGRRAVQADERGVLSKEKPFTMKAELDGHEVLVQGIIDCCFTEGDSYILVDYKSNYVGDDTSAIEDMYREQLLLYKQALELGTGKTVMESYLYLFGAGKPVRIEL